LCAITGKGPLKEHYTQLIEKENLENVSFVLPWLEPEEYPKLLAAADLGVCLHTSSSSLDLPMKVVDMFGCGLPVCAITYNCLSELVQHEANGLHFQDSLQLTDQLELLLSDLAHNKLLSQMRDTIIKQFSNSRWPENWRTHALSTFESEQ
jgi:beta-1,4-mannosyltransferase